MMKLISKKVWRKRNEKVHTVFEEHVSSEII